LSRSGFAEREGGRLRAASLGFLFVVAAVATVVVLAFLPHPAFAAAATETNWTCASTAAGATCNTNYSVPNGCEMLDGVAGYTNIAAADFDVLPAKTGTDWPIAPVSRADAGNSVGARWDISAFDNTTVIVQITNSDSTSRTPSASVWCDGDPTLVNVDGLASVNVTQVGSFAVTSGSVPALKVDAGTPTVKLSQDSTDNDVDATVVGTPNFACASGCDASLSSGGYSSLNLTWWGVWFLCGLVLMLLLAPAWMRAFPWGRSGGV
jgi:hypothetical protein